MRKFTLSCLPRLAIIASFTFSGLSLVIAHAFEHFGKLPPCLLCYEQREIHWVALGIAFAAGLVFFALQSQWARRAMLLSLTGIYGFSLWVSSYHAGVEWKFWEGPKECSGGGNPLIENPTDILSGLDDVNIISCADAAWRFLGISMAGYNALLSLALMLLCITALLYSRPRHIANS
ncbi:MAG: disulfide bond formation protein B [bacterium]